MAKKHFFDNIEIPKAKFTKEGYLSASARVTKTGVFDYRDEGNLVRVLRHPDDVFDEKSLETLKQIPVTILHPDKDISPNRIVDSWNSSFLTVGSTGDNILRDGDFVVANLKVFDANAVKKIKDENLKEISLGYETLVTDESGEYNGESYDMRQTDIRYNHLSFVSRGRAGPDVRINLDKKESDKMSNLVSVKLDGIDYQASPEVEKALGKVSAKVDSLEDAVKASKKAFDALEGERDQLKKELDEKSGADNVALIDAAAKARIDILSVADAVELDSVDELSNAKIMSAVVEKHCDGLEMDGKSEDYILARYEAIKDSLDKKSEDKRAAKMASVADATSKPGVAVDALEDSYNKMKSRISNAYKAKQ